MLLMFYKTSKMTSRHGPELARSVGHHAPARRCLPHQRADETTDDASDDGRNRRDACGVMDDDRRRRRAVVMMDVVMPRRRAVVMDRRGTAASVMRCGNCRARGKGDARNENHDYLDDLVHITPATFCLVVSQEPFSRLQRVRKPTPDFLTTFHSAIFQGRQTIDEDAASVRFW